MANVYPGRGVGEAGELMAESDALRLRDMVPWVYT